MTGDIGYLGAFAAGLISFLSPCVLPLVPAFLSFLAGQSLEQLRAAEGGWRGVRGRTVLAAAVFVAGFSLVFILLGASATLLGRWLAAYAGILAKVAGVLLVVLGLHLTGLLRIPFLLQEHRFHSRAPSTKLITAFVIGMAFAFGWSPCVGPLLAGILALAGTRETLGQGIILLIWYSAGLGVPFILAAMAVETFVGWMRRFQRYFRLVEIAAGLLLIVLGGLIFSGGLGRLAAWFGAFAHFAR